MNIFKKVALGVVVLISIKANAQTDQKSMLDALAGRFIKNLHSDDREKIFVHTNKWYYIAGEDIWLKAYCINALSHKIFRHSKIVFVDLVNDKDSIIETLLLNNQFQKLDGKISLSPFLQEGYYWLRSYTRNMLKRDINSISVQPIYIFNTQKPVASIAVDRLKIATENASDTARPDVTFFPEGGSVISGTNSTVAFRVVDKNQKPLIVSGYVTDPLDSVLVRFKTSMPGLGKFNFFIWKSRKYVAHIKLSDNKEFTYSLPLVNQFASQLSVIEQKDDYVRMQVSLGDSIYKKNKSSYVLGISRDSLCFSAVGNDMYEFAVPKNNFPAGKATLLLFDEQQKIISERNIYIDKKNQEANITTDKEKYGAREKVKLEIAIDDPAKTATEALLSVSVTDDNLVKEPAYFNNINQINNDNIELPAESNPLMSTYSPEQLDLIMLTQKNYDRSWQDKKVGKNLSASNDEDSSLNSINGKVVDQKSEPVQNGVITFFSNGGNSLSETDTTNESGRFHLPISAGLHAMQIILQVTDLKGRMQNDKIIIDTFRFPQFRTPEQLKKKFLAEEIGILKNFKAHQLDTVSIRFGKGWLTPVTIKEVKKKELSYDESKRVSRFSQIIAGSDLDLNRNSVEYALLMVHGVSLKNGFVVINGGSGGFDGGAKNEPLVMMDGAELQKDSSMGSSAVVRLFRSLSPESIDFIEVLTGSEGAAYGMKGGNGVILINTTTKQRNNDFSGMIKYSPRGFFISPPFDEPDYDKKNLKKSAEPDLRSAIFWDGNILKGNSGNVILNFFTADAQTIYTVTVAGISTNGSIIFKQIKLRRE